MLVPLNLKIILTQFDKVCIMRIFCLMELHMKRESFEDLIKRCNETHTDKYAYLGIERIPYKAAKLTIMCPEHGEFKQSAAAHVRGAGCLPCGKTVVKMKRRTSLEQAVIKSKKIHGEAYTYESLSFSDKGGAAIIHYSCETHGKITQTLSDHLGGHGCKFCGYDSARVSLEQKYEYYLAKARETHGDTYTYYGYTQASGINKFLIRCREHGEFTQRFVNHAGGEGCPKCGAVKIGKALRYDPATYLADVLRVHNEKYTYGELIYGEGDRTKIEVVCSTHGKFLTSAKDHLTKATGCPYCQLRVSKGQQEIYDLLKPFCPDLTLEYSVDSSRKIWDMASPSLKICIEYDGLVWHSSRYMSNSKNITKWRQAAAVGYRQITIYSDEWTNKQALVSRFLLQVFGVSDLPSYHGRELTSAVVDKVTAKAFLEANHAQGFRKSSQYVGLYADKLVAILGYELRASGRGRGKDLSQMEITRYATNAKVRGGFSKILSHALKLHREVKYCYTFSDNRMFTGDLYLKCGFSKVADVPHSYCYIRHEERFDKAKFQKSKASRWSVFASNGETEKELAALNGYYQMYDCGKIKWGKSIHR
jgi:hypothetical protein